MKRVAVVGSGLAGLTIAHILANSDDYEVDIYEKSGRIGMSSQSADVNFSSGEVPDLHPVDAPMRMIAPSYYPNLMSLIDYFDIELVRAKIYSTIFSYEKFDDDIKIKKKLFDFNNIKNASVWNLSQNFYKSGILGVEYARFLTTAAYYKITGKSNDLSCSLIEFVTERGYSTEFIRTLLIPYISSLVTCSLKDVEQYPAKVIFDFFEIGAFNSKLYKIKGGVNTMCEKLLDHPKINMIPIGVKSIKLNTKDQNTRKLVIATDDDIEEFYDDVIIATPPKQAHQLLKHQSTSFNAVLGDIRCTPVKVTTHSDTSSMTHPKAEWAPNNLYIDEEYIQHGTITTDTLCDADHPIDYTSGMNHTYINASQPHIQGDVNVIQTTNPLVPIREDLIIKSGVFWRAYFDPSSEQNIDKLDKLQGTDNIWVVGSYTFPGVPLLEGCIANSIRIAKAMGASAPWISEKDSNHPINKYNIPGTSTKQTLTQAYYTSAKVNFQRLPYLYQIVALMFMCMIECMLSIQVFYPLVLFFFLLINSTRLVLTTLIQI
jgi:predicted NAD/FAD-binding protein